MGFFDSIKKAVGGAPQSAPPVAKTQPSMLAAQHPMPAAKAAIDTTAGFDWDRRRGRVLSTPCSTWRSRRRDGRSTDESRARRCRRGMASAIVRTGRT